MSEDIGDVKVVVHLGALRGLARWPARFERRGANACWFSAYRTSGAGLSHRQRAANDCAGGRMWWEFLIVFRPSPFLSVHQDPFVRLSGPTALHEGDLSVSQPPPLRIREATGRVITPFQMLT